MKYLSYRIPKNWEYNYFGIYLSHDQIKNEMPSVGNFKGITCPGGTEFELGDGEAVIESFLVHKRKFRGYEVFLYFTHDGVLYKLTPGMGLKQYIKKMTGDDWVKLKDGSGDIDACKRFFIYFNLFCMDKLGCINDIIAMGNVKKQEQN